LEKIQGHVIAEAVLKGKYQKERTAVTS